MKKTMYLTAMTFVVLITAWSAGAQMMGSGGQSMMTEPERQQENAPSRDFEDEPYMMYPGWAGCNEMGPGMMGGYGMGPGMMGDYGRGYRHGHMRDEYGWGPGMNRFSSPEEYDKFMDGTKELRKKMHDMQFEYGEMMRNPKTTMGELQKKRQEMDELREKILEQSGQ